MMTLKVIVWALIFFHLFWGVWFVIKSIILFFIKIINNERVLK